MSDVETTWGDVALSTGESASRIFGTLNVQIERAEREVWLRTHRGTEAEMDAPPEEWRRWATNEETRIQVRPAMPDRMLVVSHEYEYHLPPQTESRVYVRIPLWVQVVLLDGERPLVAADIPSIVLSDTWWGDLGEGSLGYWLSTRARGEVTDDLFLPHIGMCPLRLINDSDEALPTDRFTVRAPHLTLFRDGKRNWTDEVTVRYEASDEGSEIRFAAAPPDEAPDARELAAPRVPEVRGFRAKTFDRLKSLSGLGF